VWIFALILLTAKTGFSADPNIKVGLLETMFQDVPRSVLDAMADPFRSLMKNQTGLGGDVEICANCTTMAEKLKNKTLSVGVMHGFEYAWAKEQNSNLVPLLVTVPHGRKAQAMIVVKGDSEIKAVKDLKDQPISVCKGTKAYSRLFFEKLQSSNQGLKIDLATKSQSSEEGLTAVVTGKQKAMLVDAAFMAAYQIQQPGAYSALRILSESDLFPCSVIVTQKENLSDAVCDQLKNGLSTSSKSPQGRAMLTIWGLKGFDRVPEEYEEHCKKILKAYPTPKAVKTDIVTTENR
jgi:ABC-type phosphate/phosphonate transport system substrate-binding protein